MRALLMQNSNPTPGKANPRKIQEGGSLVDPRTQSPKLTRTLLLGGGYAEIYTACRLEQLFAGRNDVEIALVSRR